VITTEIIIIFILLLINAFFAMSEMAVVSSSKPMLRQWANKGNKRAARALNLAENSGKFLSTVQVGITLVGTLAGAYGGATIAEKIEPYFDSISFINPHGEFAAVAIVVGVITYLSVIIGELIPKQLALSNSEKIAMVVAGPMTAISRVFYPIVYLFEISADKLMVLFGISKSDDAKVTESEIDAILAEGAENGVIEKQEHEMLRRIIKLGDRDVKSVMTHRKDIAFIDVNSSLDQVRKVISESKHSRYPVIDKEDTSVIGIIHAKELLQGTLKNEAIIIKDYVQDIATISDNTSCLRALEIFRKSHTHVALVVDEYGSTEGIITVSDLMEAIIGTLRSNYDEDIDSHIIKRDDSSWLISGRTPIEEIHLTIGLEEITVSPSYDTIAGFIMQEMETYPTESAKFEKFGYIFEVVDMDGPRIDKILLSKEIAAS
jgi:putative hemolysin